MSARYCPICGLYDCAEPDCGSPDNGTCGAPECAHIYRNARTGCHLCKTEEDQDHEP